jgi:hypothetical protein
MTTITTPTVSTGILQSWGASVAAELNRRQVAILAADVSKAASSWSDIDGLTATVVNGRFYLLRGFLTWTNSSTSGGIRVGFNHAGGNLRALVRFTGETAADALVNEWHTTTDDGAGVGTVDASATPRMVQFEGRFQCTADGTFAIRYYRNTTGTALIQAGSGFELIADA